MGIKLFSHLMKLLHLMILPSQQFCLYGTLFNVYDTFMKHRSSTIETNASFLLLFSFNPMKATVAVVACLTKAYEW